MINNTAFISGPQVKELEDQLASHCRPKTLHHLWQWHGRTVNGVNGLGYQTRRRSIRTGFYILCYWEVVSFEGATPIFVDVKEDTFNMDPGKLEDAIQAVRTEGKLTPKLIIPVDLFGLPAEYQEILKIAEKIRNENPGRWSPGIWRYAWF